MILIADSGSTKTDWRFIDAQGAVQKFQCAGLSPYLQTETHITEELTKLFKHLPFAASSQLKIFYYGTGCSTIQKCEIMKRAIRSVFTEAKINIYHDLLAAARAACGKQEGITAIIGTGSNTCYYDGTEIKDQVVNLGYILGDEGSGAHIGKTFLRALLYGELPQAISDAFYRETALSKDLIIDAVYSKPMANKYMASFTKFIKQHIQEPSLKNIIYTCFDDLFSKHICKYPQHKTVALNCVGSVAYHFKDILAETAKKNGVVIGKIVLSPIEELVGYHMS